MKTPIYIDSIDNISLVDGVVRLDLMVVTGPKNDDTNAPKAAQVGAIATSVHGFVRLYDQLTQVLRQMESQGVIKRVEQTEDKKA